jgi:adenosylcobinamide-phosphate synthase
MALLGHSPVRAWRTYRRDARLHSSPNSGIPESLMAGGLGIQLGGINQYRGVISRGATLGDLVYDRRPEHLLQAVRVMWLTSVLALFLCMGLAVLAG